MFKVRIRGIDTYIRDLAKLSDKTFFAAEDGILKAAQHLLEKVKNKIGVYQPTGGDPGGYGRWKKLKFETIKKTGSRPLIYTGALKDSFSIIKGGKGRLSASVGSDSDYLIHHVYGAPGANVPMRDPIRITAKEEMEKCHDMIEKEIMKEIETWW